ncbi:hypothetical protein GGI15_003802 [Coemansia interrupta]|uniref:Uncharacterized protein n=1 Tax=Coemansia interrupta TaxID=1126814 RepID=A0A9W8H7S0_9FUNG|nr:hypothetical protein GGI15_003802 [Coemansia interrupta]
MPSGSSGDPALLRKIDDMQAQINELNEQLATKTRQLDDIRRIINTPALRCGGDDDQPSVGLAIDSSWKGIATPGDSARSPDNIQEQPSKASNANLEPLGRRKTADFVAEDDEDSVWLFANDNFDDGNDNERGSYSGNSRRRRSSPVPPRSSRSAQLSRFEHRDSRSRSPPGCGNRGKERSPNRRHTLNHSREDRKASDYRPAHKSDRYGKRGESRGRSPDRRKSLCDTGRYFSKPGNQRTGGPASRKGHCDGWVTHNSASLDAACGMQDQSELPMMPSSCNQFMNARPLPSSSDKVNAWRDGNTESRGWGDLSQNERSGHSPAVSNHSLTGHHRLEDAADEEGALCDPADDSSDDSDGGLLALRSKPAAATRSASIPQFKDVSGKSVASTNLLPLWGVCAWASLSGLEDAYRISYRTRLCTDSSRCKIKLIVKALPRVQKRKVTSNGQELTLYFKSGNHLKQTANMQRVHVWKPVPQAVLFYYLVTTVLQPLDQVQAATVCSLWRDEFKVSPLGIATVLDANGHGWTEWADMAELWKAACDWLSMLAKDVVKHGKAYVTKPTDKTGWDSIDYNLCANARKLPVDKTCSYSKVFGLQNTEVIDLIKISPILLSSTWANSQIEVLIDAL